MRGMSIADPEFSCLVLSLLKLFDARNASYILKFQRRYCRYYLYKLIS